MAREKIELTIEGRKGFVIVPTGLTDNEVINFAVKNPDAFQQTAISKVKDFGTQLAEVGTEFMGNAATFPVSGIAGAIETVRSGPAAGDQMVKNVQAKGRELFGAKTAQGQQAMQTIAENVPSVVTQAVQGFEDVSKAAGDDTLEKTGSPVLAAASYTAPTAILELVTLGTFGRLKNGARLFDEIGDATPEFRKALDGVELDFDDLSPEIKDSLPVIMNDRLRFGGDMDKAVDEVLSAELGSGSTKGGLAKFNLENGNVVRDPLGANAVEQGYDPSYIQSVKTSTPATKKQMLRMARMMKALKQDRTRATEIRPSDIVGESVMKRIDYLDDVIDKRAKKLNDYAESDQFKQVEIDLAPISSELKTILDDLGVEYNPSNISGQKNYTGSDIQFDDSAQGAIQDVITGLTTKKLTAQRLHQLKRSFDRMINYKKKTMRVISPEGEKIVQRIRKSLNTTLRNSSPVYAKINDDLSLALDATGEFDKVMKSISLDTEDAASGIGQMMRKVLSKTQDRTKIMAALRKLNENTATLGGKYDDEVGRLVLFSDMLDTRHGDVATRGFSQEVAKGVDQGIERSLGRATIDVAGQAVEFGINQAARAGRKAQGKKDLSDFEAFESLRKLLQAGNK